MHLGRGGGHVGNSLACRREEKNICWFEESVRERERKIGGEKKENDILAKRKTQGEIEGKKKKTREIGREKERKKEW